MKKLRFGLLAKIILLTGLLNILTVSTSLTVNLLISHHNTQEAYKNSCEDVTDNIESVFFSEEDLSVANSIMNMVINQYSAVRDKYTEMTEAELTKYSEDVVVSLFEPKPGSMGLDYEKSHRRNYYSEAISRMQTLCANMRVPFASLNLYDSQYKRLIVVAHSNIDLQGNMTSVGLVDESPEDWELEFYDGAGSTGNQFRTLIKNDAVMSYNVVKADLNDSNYKCFVRGEYSLTEFNQTFKKQLLTELIISFAASVVLVIVYAILTKFILVRNVEKLTDATDKFVSNMKENKPLEVINSNVNSHDEMKNLSDSFDVMQSQIITYVESIKQAESIEQAFNAEVEIASKIQLESLPANVHFNRNIELRAFIKAAKGVGGDFYDYFYVDDDHLAVVIADVSGKGIPASLFMMRSRESIRSATMNADDLSSVFFKVNNALCINNKEGFFVTAFLGVLDLKTNTFNYVNAGHEKPFVKHENKCERLEGESNFVLGLEEDFTYEEQSIQLNEGDSVVLYTDGLNEAINSNKEEFGYDRIAKSLGKSGEIKENISQIINDLAEFEGAEEQFDDITLLSFNIKKNVVTYSYQNPTYEDIDDLTNKVNDYLSNLDQDLVSKIDIVIDEAMNNIISYGKTKTNKALMLSVEKTGDGATLIFIDNSHPFDPLLREMRTVQENMEEGIVGGLGISIIKSISKDAEYVYSNNKNILVIKF